MKKSLTSILNHISKKTSFLMIVLFFLSFSCFASNEYNINGKNIHFDDFSSSPNECWTYANNVYFKILGQNFSNSFDDSNNSLRNLSDSDLALTLEHLKAYVSDAALGSCLRICNSDYLHGSDGWGHSQIIVQKDSNGFTVFEGGLSQSPYSREKYYTWSEYINTNWLGGTYSHIKYIKWPGAPAYSNSSTSPNVTLLDFNIPETLITGELPTLSGKIYANCTITWLWVGVSEGGTWNHLLQAQCNPMANEFDISSLLSQLDLSSLSPNKYTMRIECTAGDEYWVLCAKDFQLEKSNISLDFNIPQNFTAGNKLSLSGTLSANCIIAWVWVGVSEGETWNHLLQAQCNPMTNEFDISSLLSQLDFSSLSPGNYTMRIECTGGGEYWSLCAKEFSVISDIPVSPFIDVQNTNDYFYTPVLWAAENGITYGVDSTHFVPNQTCTRAQVVTFLWRAMGCPKPTTTNCSFVDVNSSDYFYKAILWAAENSITYGVDTTHFNPNATVTRADFVTFLWRAQGKPSHSSKCPFVDIPSKTYYYNAVLWAAENKIAYGIDNTHFAPTQFCTRGQVVTFLHRNLA